MMVFISYDYYSRDNTQLLVLDVPVSQTITFKYVFEKTAVKCSFENQEGIVSEWREPFNLESGLRIYAWSESISSYHKIGKIDGNRLRIFAFIPRIMVGPSVS